MYRYSNGTSRISRGSDTMRSPEAEIGAQVHVWGHGKTSSKVDGALAKQVDQDRPESHIANSTTPLAIKV
eukprot:5235577-Amphidinium_carterae.1